MTRAAEIPPGLSRADLAERTEAVLNRGNWGNPDVFLVRVGGERVVVKDYRPRSLLVRATIGRIAISRELAVYRALGDVDFVPRLLGALDELALAIEYRRGTRIGRSLAGRVPPTVLDELERAIETLHARGIVHLDLSHRSNVLVTDDGHPVLVDFATAVRLRPDGLLGRLLLPWLRRVDRRALEKWRDRLSPQRPRAVSGSSAPGGGASDGGRGASRPT